MHEVWKDGLKLHAAAPEGTVVEDDDGDVTVKGKERWVGMGAAPSDGFAQFGPWRVLRWGYSID